MKKAEAQGKYGVKAYPTWNRVPSHLFTRTALKAKGIIVPKDAKPDAVKSEGLANSKEPYLLFDINKYAQHACIQ